MAWNPIHATCVAVPRSSNNQSDGDGRPRAILLRGPSGAGKSDLALRLIDRGWSLVADDQTAVKSDKGQLLARTPQTITGKLEVRGLGIAELPRVAEAAVILVVDLVPAATIERLPAPAETVIDGTSLPLLRLDAFGLSAPVKVDLAVGRNGGRLSVGAIDRDTRRSETGSKLEHHGEAAVMAPDSPNNRLRRIVLVTGLSGAGRTAALDNLEDLGYEAIDNPPLELVARIAATAEPKPIAIGIDIRTRDFAAEPFLALLESLKSDPDRSVSLLFVDCDDDILRRRYSETRRRHPLAEDRPLADGIAAERRLLAPLRARADLVIDTSGLTPGDFRQVLTGHLGSPERATMAVFVTSFSYRTGLPRSADLVFDVRFLKNPHYETELRPLTGRDPEVAEFVSQDADFSKFFEDLTAMLDPLLPRYEREGKSYLTIAFGCTGGRHRSVAVAESLAGWLRAQGRPVTLVHRDLTPTYRTKVIHWSNRRTTAGLKESVFV